jgi:aminoglycoside phosphotransferase (APT) family kinase protein
VDLDAFAAVVGRPVRAARPLEPPFAGHGSDVWRVETDAGPVVVRRSREAPPGRNAFVQGLHRLFGIAPWQADEVAAVHELLAPLAPVPQLLACRPPYLAVSHLAGTAPRTFTGLGGQLGDLLGRIHARRFHDWGQPAGARRWPLACFHLRLAEMMAELGHTVWAGHAPLQRLLPPVLAELRALPPPREACLVMADIDAGQFLVDPAGRLRGPVDLEAYVVAPPALELACLEYQLGLADAAAFLRAYVQHRPWPSLAGLRRPYRLFHYVVRFLLRGPDLGGWSGQPARFP